MAGTPPRRRMLLKAFVMALWILGLVALLGAVRAQQAALGGAGDGCRAYEVWCGGSSARSGDALFGLLVGAGLALIASGGLVFALARVQDRRAQKVEAPWVAQRPPR